MSETETVDRLFHALADPTRRKIVQILSEEGQQSATMLYEQFDVSQPAISQHMGVLREAGLVIVEKKAQYRIYSINRRAITEIEDWTAGIKKMWERRFRALEKILEIQKEHDEPKRR